MKFTKQIKIAIISFISIGLIVSIYKFNDYLFKEKRWFYSTSTDIKAFDRLYWGMSNEEVERSLNIKFNSSNYLKEGDLPLDFDVRFRESAKNDFKYTKIINNYSKVILRKYDFDFYGEDIDELELYFYKNQLFKLRISGKLWSYNMNYIKMRQFDSLIVKDLILKYGKAKNELDKKSNHWVRNLSWDNKKTNLNFLIVKPMIVENQYGELKSYEFKFYVNLKYLHIDNSIDEDIKNYKPDTF